MTKQEFAALAFRVLALWVLTQVATSLSTAVVAFITMLALASSQQDFGGAWFTMIFGGVPSLVLFVVGILLWRRADEVALRIYGAPKEGAQAGVGRFAADDVLPVAFAAIGMYVLVTAIPALARHVARPLFAEVPFRKTWENTRWQCDLWVNVFQIALGVWLLIGMRGIARVVRSLQRRDPSGGGTKESKLGKT